MVIFHSYVSLPEGNIQHFPTFLRLVLSLEREGARVFLSSLRSKTAERLLLAHGVVGPSVPERKVFVTLDQALQKCEETLVMGVVTLW